MNLSESYKKRLGELAGLNESKDWVDKTSNYGNLKDLLDNFGASDWSYKVFEADKFHKFCPLGFDLEFDKNKKEVILYVCTRNDVEYRDFWETVEQEFSTEFLGYNTAESYEKSNTPIITESKKKLESDEIHLPELTMKKKDLIKFLKDVYKIELK